MNGLGQGARRRALALTRQQSLPREGSQVRLVYDLLYEHRGHDVPAEDWEALRELVPNLDMQLVYLVQRYGLEVSGRCLLSMPGPRIRFTQ